MSELQTKSGLSRASGWTRERILAVALNLFNEHGTSISLTMVSRAAKLSTSNLQYHFKTKESLVLALVEALFREHDRLYPGETTLKSVEDLRQMFLEAFRVQWKYRFFFREQGALLRRDLSLASRFRDLQRVRIASQSSILRATVAASGRAALPEDLLTALVTGGWVLTQTALTYLEALGGPWDEQALQSATDILMAHYGPYLPITGV